MVACEDDVGKVVGKFIRIIGRASGPCAKVGYTTSGFSVACINRVVRSGSREAGHKSDRFRIRTFRNMVFCISLCNNFKKMVLEVTGKCEKVGAFAQEVESTEWLVVYVCVVRGRGGVDVFDKGEALANRAFHIEHVIAWDAFDGNNTMVILISGLHSSGIVEKSNVFVTIFVEHERKGIFIFEYESRLGEFLHLFGIGSFYL